MLRRCSEAGNVPTVTSKGNLDLLDRGLLGFFCSVRCPGDVILKTYDLARALRNTDVTFIGGFQSPMEKDLLELVLRGSSSIVVYPARGLDTMRIPQVWKNPLAEGRLLLLSFFDDSIRRPTTDLTARRNSHVAALTDRLLIAYAEKGGKTEKLCKDVLAQGKPAFALDSPDNAHLLQLGVAPVKANDPTPLLAA
jgi:predicted Rossmann fold nucleotide-binding protein DprA/Smf involved in DNA uptake